MNNFVYIITNEDNSILYIGTSCNLSKKILQHQNKSYNLSFAARFDLYKLVYWKTFPTNMEAANFRKKLKAASLETKERFITAINPDWEDLADQLPEPESA